MSEKKNENGYKGRFREIAAVLHKHEISKGITPEKLRLILEDLGPTFVKVGQLMSLRSDILPKNYCDELQKLCSDVPPMPFYEVEEVLRDSFGYEWQEEFEWIDETPLGSASIAQVHRARLKTGEEVVIKVQRKGIYETMARDIGLMHKLVSLVPPISITDMVDFKMVLNELWKVTQEEMNFIIEAGNMEEFKEKNRDVAFVDTPVLFKEYTTSSVIVMEYIDGYAIDDKEHLAMYENLPIVDFSSGKKKENTYVFVANYKNKKKRFVIEPCEEILKAVYVDLSPRRAYIKK